MQTIKLISVSKSIGINEILCNINLQINPGEKYGLIGPNGCGKTTLLNIIAGCDKEFEGQILGKENIKTGYVRQNLHYPDNTKVSEAVLEEYRDLIQPLRLAEQQLADPGCPDMAMALDIYQQARNAYDKAGIDMFLFRMKSILDSLGLPGRLEQQVQSLSGGEKNLLGLACALAGQPDLLILDEPGNHLDFQGLAWFEEYLKNYRQTVLIVSHNRYLLDRICSRIIEMDNHRVNIFKGNYSACRVEKLKKLAAHQADYSANARRIARLEELVKRFEEYARRTADPSWGRRLHARRTQLKREKAQAVERPQLNGKKIEVSLEADRSKAAIALQLKGYNRTIGTICLFDKANLEIFCGEKVGLIGPNGAGKTTLIRDIVGQGNWEHPVIRVGPSLQVGYMAQYPDLFNPANTIEEEMRSLGSISRNEAFSLVSRFLFTWEDMHKKIGSLSGGEINRLQLALLIYLKPGFLILDEPTNHLDIPSREAVEEALDQFEGTLLVVSHDRYFLDKVVTRVVEIKAQQLIPHNGNFSVFWLRHTAMKRISAGRVATRGAERGRQACTKQSSRGQQQQITSLEKRIMEAEKEKILLEEKITAVLAARAHREGSRLAAELEKLTERIERMYEEWEAMG